MKKFFLFTGALLLFCTLNAQTNNFRAFELSAGFGFGNTVSTRGTIWQNEFMHMFSKKFAYSVEFGNTFLSGETVRNYTNGRDSATYTLFSKNTNAYNYNVNALFTPFKSKTGYAALGVGLGRINVAGVFSDYTGIQTAYHRQTVINILCKFGFNITENFLVGLKGQYQYGDNEHIFAMVTMGYRIGTKDIPVKSDKF